MYVAHGQLACSLPARPQEKPLGTGRGGGEGSKSRRTTPGNHPAAQEPESARRMTECLAVTEGPGDRAAGDRAGSHKEGLQPAPRGAILRHQLNREVCLGLSSESYIQDPSTLSMKTTLKW